MAFHRTEEGRRKTGYENPGKEKKVLTKRIKAKMSSDWGRNARIFNLFGSKYLLEGKKQKRNAGKYPLQALNEKKTGGDGKI